MNAMPEKLKVQENINTDRSPYSDAIMVLLFNKSNYWADSTETSLVHA